MKQTAVQWLEDQIFKSYEVIDIDLFHAIQQALEMEKEQIVDANLAGMQFIPVDPDRYQEDAEQYYNETFNTNEK